MSTNLDKNHLERQRDKETKRQRDRETEKQKDRKTSECLLIWKKLTNKVSAQKDLK